MCVQAYLCASHRTTTRNQVCEWHLHSTSLEHLIAGHSTTVSYTIRLSSKPLARGCAGGNHAPGVLIDAAHAAAIYEFYKIDYGIYQIGVCIKQPKHFSS